MNDFKSLFHKDHQRMDYDKNFYFLSYKDIDRMRKDCVISEQNYFSAIIDNNNPSMIKGLLPPSFRQEKLIENQALIKLQAVPCLDTHF